MAYFKMVGAICIFNWERGSHVNVAIKLFDRFIKPILLYVSDIWDAENLNDSDSVENLHFKFCKHVLLVNRQLMDIAVERGLGLGRYPIYTYVKFQLVKF